MQTETFEDPGHGGGTDISQMYADILSRHPEGHVFTTADSFQYPEITF